MLSPPRTASASAAALSQLIVVRTMLPTMLPLVLAITHPDTAARTLHMASGDTITRADTGVSAPSQLLRRLEGRGRVEVDASEGLSETGGMPASSSTCSTRALKGRPDGDGVFHATDAAYGSLNRSGCIIMVDPASCVPTIPDSLWPANVTACSESAGEDIVMNWLVGPMTSRGGFDWWGIMFADIAASSLGQVGGYAVTLHEGDVPPNGAAPGPMLTLPPIHIHHATVNAFGGEFIEAGDNMLQAGGFASLQRDFSSRGVYSKVIDDTVSGKCCACLGSQHGAPRTSAGLGYGLCATVRVRVACLRAGSV